MGTAVAASPAAQNAVCSEAAAEENESLELLQVGAEHSRKLEKHSLGSQQGANQSAAGGAEASGNESFNPFSMMPAKTKYCPMSTLCAEQTSHIDFTKLGALCIAMTGGAYDPMRKDLPDGTCASQHFVCPASSTAIHEAFTSGAMMQGLPAPLAAAVQ